MTNLIQLFDLRKENMARTLASRQRWEELAEAAHFNAKELARLCQVSTRQLQRDFRRCLGRSPQDWLNERRILAARELLLAGQSIKWVAFELGFKQPSHFCRQFKRFNHVTASGFVLSEALNSRACRSEIVSVVAG
jgi:AraC-like DNA-binding protein